MLCVSFTTEREWSDVTTRCAAGEHPFIKHDTVVAYQLATLISKKTMADFLDGGTFTKKEPCSPALLIKVREGLLKSDFTPNHIRRAFEQARKR
jgi:hypothetical protein